MIILSSRLLKKSSNGKSKLVKWIQVSTLLSNITFHLRPIWLRTLVPNNSESCQRLFPSFCALPSEVAVLFYWIWANCLFYICCFAQDWILKMQIASYALFLLRVQWMIERLSEAMSVALVGKNSWEHPNFHFTWEQNQKLLFSHESKVNHVGPKFTLH